jgi:small neutral amino acid transporter SnatA (MarC family)
MNVVEVLIGVSAIIVSVLVMWIALPRGGQVRAWLRGDTKEALYVITALSILAFGVANIVTGLVPG